MDPMDIEKWSNSVILGLLPIFLAILGLNMEPVVGKIHCSNEGLDGEANV